VVSAVPDMANHTVTVELRDENVPIAGIVKALGIAGYTTGEPAVIGAEKK
jgi:hypothetical protein